MSKQRINVGTGVNTGTGDTLRSAMEKCNNNFDELYDLMGQDSTGKSIDISGNTISSTFTNTDINISPNGTGDVVIDSDLVVNTIKSDDSTTVTINDGLTIKGDLNITGTFNLSSLDADSTTVSNLEVDNFKASAIVLESEGISSNDNDTTLPTSAAVKDYVDTQLSGSSHNITFVGDDSTGTAVTQGETFKIAGTQNITTAVSGDTLTITGPDLSSYATTSYVDAQNTAQALTFVGDDSTGTAVNSGETFKIAGTQNITTAVSGDTLTVTGPDLTSYLTNSNLGNIRFSSNAISTSDGSAAVTVAINGGDGNDPPALINKKWSFGTDGTFNFIDPFTGSPLTDGTISTTKIGQWDDAYGWGDHSSAGYATATSSTAFSNKTGNISQWTNDSGYLTNSTVTLVGDDSTGTTLNSGETVKIAGGTNITTAVSGDTLTVTGPDLSNYLQNTGTQTIDNLSFNDNIISTSSNADLILDPGGTGQVISNSAFKFNAGYIEAINSLTSSSTITVDFSTASVHTVTLAENTEFVVTNLPTGGTGTIIITQDGGGTNTGSFGTDGSTAVKFAGGTPTLSTAGGAIDVVTIFNDGTNYLGNIAKAYA